MKIGENADKIAMSIGNNQAAFERVSRLSILAKCQVKFCAPSNSTGRRSSRAMAPSKSRQTQRGEDGRLLRGGRCPRRTSIRKTTPIAIDGQRLVPRIPRFQRSCQFNQRSGKTSGPSCSTKNQRQTAHYLAADYQSTDDKQFDVIDGQQRLTTLSLIVLAVLKSLERLIDAGHAAADNRRRSDQIRQTYIGYLDPVGLVSRSKLIVNRNNNNYYQTYRSLTASTARHPRPKRAYARRSSGSIAAYPTTRAKRSAMKARLIA